MASAEETRNIEAFNRFHDAVNAGDAESLARTIDEFVLPDAQIRTPLPIDATGAEKLKRVWSTSWRSCDRSARSALEEPADGPCGFFRLIQHDQYLRIIDVT